MHTAALDFVKTIKALYPTYFSGVRVLEIGSANVNGTIRSLFTNCQYTGLDLYTGPDVDVVQHAVDYMQANPTPAPHTIITCEALEHDSRWQQTVKEAVCMIGKHGGLLIITCAGPNRAEHGTTRTTPADSPATTDYYGNISTNQLLDVIGEALMFLEQDASHCAIHAQTGRQNKDTYLALHAPAIL